jgi:hypothetical protein
VPDGVHIGNGSLETVGPDQSLIPRIDKIDAHLELLAQKLDTARKTVIRTQNVV